MASLVDLPTEVLKSVVEFVGVFDSIYLSQTNKELRNIIQTNAQKNRIEWDSYVECAHAFVCTFCHTVACCCLRGFFLRNQLTSVLRMKKSQVDRVVSHDTVYKKEYAADRYMDVIPRRTAWLITSNDEWEFVRDRCKRAARAEKASETRKRQREEREEIVRREHEEQRERARLIDISETQLHANQTPHECVCGQWRARGCRFCGACCRNNNTTCIRHSVRRGE